MADEAFALSPISARSASPTDADYDAIREAFMETARGRWFLGEYAKRNRNADTAMVLEAVARLEQSVAASRAEAKAAEPPPSSVSASILAATIATDPALAPPDELLTSIKAILERTRAAMAAVLAEPGMAGAIEPLQSSARIIREIAWGLRESGADGRICNILDTQVRAITAACDALAATDHHDAVLHAFDASLAQIEKLSQDETMSAAETVSSAKAVIPDAVIPDMDASVIDAPAAMVATETNQDTVAEDTAAAETFPVAVADDLVMENRTDTPSSLGASLIARGIVAPSGPAPHDPLAPIRRMSQAEKIAFFS
jgi:hypothetical protein